MTTTASLPGDNEAAELSVQSVVPNRLGQTTETNRVGRVARQALAGAGRVLHAMAQAGEPALPAGHLPLPGPNGSVFWTQLGAADPNASSTSRHYQKPVGR